MIYDGMTARPLRYTPRETPYISQGHPPEVNAYRPKVTVRERTQPRETLAQAMRRRWHKVEEGEG